MINLNPDPMDIDEFIYLEMIDTVAYDWREENNYKNFFETISSCELPISSKNKKIDKNITNNIRYEYTFTINAEGKSDKKKKNKDMVEESIEDDKKKEILQSEKLIFSVIRTMAYIFVFDYYDLKSFKDIKDFAKKLGDFEDGEKRKNPNYEPSVKAFICNKYPFDTDNCITLVQEKNEKEYEHFSLYDRDKKALDYVEELKQVFSSLWDLKEHDKEEEKRIEILTKKSLFFTNTKWNKGVTECFEIIFKRIYRNEALWKRTQYEKHLNKDEDKNKKYISQDSTNINNNQSSSKFYSCFCFGRRGEEANSLKQEIIVEDQDHFFNQNVSSDEEESNMTFKAPDLENQKQVNKDLKNAGLKEAEDNKEQKSTCNVL
jgi:hypothetical protein